ncbi:MAG: GGDEF domain-containing protein [Aquabacterium sp.]|jgi:diguanylate cyclase (GGDEF)-like protein|nr:MAG: GGDEF domain-containing protein [Aquabacterium sp.]
MTDPASALRPPTGDALAGVLVRWLMGPAGTVRQAVKRLLLALPAYAFVAGLLLVSARLGRVEPQSAWLMVGYLGAGAALFFALLRSGAVAHSADPSLVFPQLIFHVGAVALAYAFIENGRSLALQWLCIILVLDMRRLSSGQVRLATGLAIALLLGTVGLQWMHDGPRMRLAPELINVGMACVTLAVLLLVAAAGRRLQRQLAGQGAELAQAAEQMRALSVRDGLTQLYNRRHMQALLEEEAARHRRSGRPLSLAILDIDFFKRVNDRHGHGVGDAVLRDFALLAQGAADGGQAVARWGGEEFLLLMPETTPELGLQALERLRLAVRRHDWSAHAEGLAVSFSAGLCAHEAGQPLQHTLERADRALYRAKAEGRDRSVLSMEELA